MRKNSSFNHFVMLATAAVAMLMASCIKDEVVDVPFIPTESETIGFGINLENLDDTRAASRNRVGKHDLKSADGEFTLPMGVYVEDGIHSANADKAETRGAKLDAIGNSFTVWASLANGDTSTLFFPAKGVVFENDGTSYKSNPAYFWPGAGTLNFTAVANAPESGFVPNLNTAGTALESFTYTVPADATAQEDIVVATASVGGANNKTVPLNFKHIMSAVNFTVGEKVANGVIKSITINNIKTTGSYNVATGTWTPNTDSKDSYSVAFSSTVNGNYEPNDKANGTIINDGECTFMMMPQVLDADAEVVVEFIYDNAPSAVKQLRANIAIDPENPSQRREWAMGKTTYYSISVDENYNLTITPKGDVLDAHYVMTDVTVNVDTEKDQAWTLTVEATNIDSDDVSIEYKDKLNTLIKNDGYWINNIVEGSTTKSARGTKTVKGTTKGAHTITVFIPENITADERKITLTLSLDSDPTKAKKTEYLYQMCPYWDEEKGFGWEKVENSEVGQYGFTWNRIACYLFTYSFRSNGGSGTVYSKAEAVKFVTDLMTSFGLPIQDDKGNDTTAPNYGGFVTIDTYTNYQFGTHIGSWFTPEWHTQTIGTRLAVIIDYTKLNFNNMMSMDKGLDNTKGFFTASALLQFEEALKSMEKVGDESGVAFRPIDNVNVKDDGSTELTSGKFFFHNYVRWDGSKAIFIDNGGSTNDASGILQYVIRRNAFNLVTVTSADGQNKYTSLDMNANNIKWYLPAVRQFDNAILNWATGNTTFTPSNFWSSTAAANNQAYAGGTTAPESRENLHQVVVQRIVSPIPQPTTISEIDTEEMKGGENGEAQWVE